MKLQLPFRKRQQKNRRVCLACTPEIHKERNGACIIDGRPWPCKYAEVKK